MKNSTQKHTKPIYGQSPDIVKQMSNNEQNKNMMTRETPGRDSGEIAIVSAAYTFNQ